MLVEQLQIDLEHYLEQAVVRGSVSADISRPHVNQKDVGHCESEK